MTEAEIQAREDALAKAAIDAMFAAVRAIQPTQAPIAALRVALDSGNGNRENCD
jgi:hypothetical protein